MFFQIDDEILKKVGVKMYLYTNFEMHGHRSTGCIHGFRRMAASTRVVDRKYRHKKLASSQRAAGTSSAVPC